MTEYWITTLRKELGWTQESMAGYLEVQRCNLAQAERRMRDLPAHAHIKALELLQLTQQLKKDEHKRSLPHTQEIHLLLQQEDIRLEKARRKQQKEARHQHDCIRKELREMEKAYQAALNTLKVLARLRLQFAKNNPTQLTLLDLSQKQAEARLKRNSPAAQHHLRTRLAGVRAMMEV